MLLAAVWVVVVVVVGGGECAACIRFGALLSIFSPAQLLPLLVMCLRIRGCPVVLDIELSVSALYHKTRATAKLLQFFNLNPFFSPK